MTPGISAFTSFFQATTAAQASKVISPTRIKLASHSLGQSLGCRATRLQEAEIVLAYVLAQARPFRLERASAGSDAGQVALPCRRKISSTDELQARGEFEMSETDKRLFVGIKISTKLQHGLDSPAPGTDRYFKENNGDFLQIITQGEEKLIGRFIKDGFPVGDLDNVSRNVRSIVRIIAGDHRLEEDAVHIYIR
jgi:hypothetical protein